MNVNCVECGHEFEFEIKTITLENVDIVFAECPKCKKRYLSFVVDKEVRESFDKTQRLRKRINDRKLSFAKRQKASRKLKKLTEENRRLMHQKKHEYQYLIKQVI